MKTMKKLLCALLAFAMMATVLAACGSKEPDPVNTKTGTYDEMVAYLTAKGYIAEGTTPVDITTTAGYVQDNTGGEMPFAPIADKAEDYGGLWLFWWSEESQTDESGAYYYLAQNAGNIVYMGGACVLQTDAYSGAFAIAFADDYAQKDAVIADFNSLPSE